MIQDGSSNITRFKDVEDALQDHQANPSVDTSRTARIHFHIPLHSQPKEPFKSTIDHTINTLNYLKLHPETCSHLEMETYTWGVLPDELQAPIEDQLTQEHLWVIETMLDSNSIDSQEHTCGDTCNH